MMKVGEKKHSDGQRCACCGECYLSLDGEGLGIPRRVCETCGSSKIRNAAIVFTCATAGNAPWFWPFWPFTPDKGCFTALVEGLEYELHSLTPLAKIDLDSTAQPT